MFRFLNWYGLPRIHVYAFSTVVADPIGDIINRVASILLCSPLEIREGISKLSDEGIDDKAVNKHYCEGYIVRGKDKYFNGRGHNDDDDDDDDDNDDDEMMMMMMMMMIVMIVIMIMMVVVVQRWFPYHFMLSLRTALLYHIHVVYNNKYNSNNMMTSY